MADDNPTSKTPPGSPPLSMPKKDDKHVNRPSSSSNYSVEPRIATLYSQPKKRPLDNQNRQAFYAGGSEHSGQQVLGPINNDDHHRMVKKMFKRMMQMMHHSHAGEEADEALGSSSGVAPFAGSGFVLGAEQTISQPADRPNLSTNDENESETDIIQYPAFAGSGFTLGTSENDSKLIKGVTSNDENDEEDEEDGDKEENSDEDDDIDSSFFGRGYTLGAANSDPNRNEDDANDDDENVAIEQPPNRFEYQRPFPGTGFTLGATDNESKPVQGYPVYRANATDDLHYEQFPVFVGAGFTLGTSEADSRRIDGLPVPSSADDDDDEATTIVRIWSNGISVNDGPLRSFNDPQILQIVSDIRRNRLSGGETASGVKMRVEDHHHEEYTLPSTFACEGYRLESATETVNKQPTITATTSTSSSDPVVLKAKALSAALSFLNFDQSKPGTKIQIRLANGTR